MPDIDMRPAIRPGVDQALAAKVCCVANVMETVP
jgi:hypothetical protein